MLLLPVLSIGVPEESGLLPNSFHDAGGEIGVGNALQHDLKRGVV